MGIKTKIKKGDTVYIRKGKDAGRKGVVLSIVKDGTRVLVEGINIVKRNTKPDPSRERAGGILEMEASVAISNVALWNQAAGKPDRVGYKFLEDGRKVRIFKSTGEMVE